MIGVRTSSQPTLVLFVVLVSPGLADRGSLADEPQRPSIRKLGTLDLGMVETTPVVFRDRLYRFEYVRKDYHANKTGDSFFRFMDVETGKATPAFAEGYDLGCAYADGESMLVFGVDNWEGENIAVFRSRDLEHWEQRPALRLPGWGLFNTSVCKAGDRYVMAIEVGKPPEVVGSPPWSELRDAHRAIEGFDPLGAQPAQPGLEGVSGGQVGRQLEAERCPAGEDCPSRGPEQLRPGPMRVQGQDDHHV
jgi:hypothetical protein